MSVKLRAVRRVFDTFFERLTRTRSQDRAKRSDTGDSQSGPLVALPPRRAHHHENDTECCQRNENRWKVHEEWVGRDSAECVHAFDYTPSRWRRWE